MNRPAVDPKRTNLLAVPATLLTDDGYPEYAPPGCFERNGERIITIACPGCGRVSAMSAGDPKPPVSPSWLVSGEPHKPTLRPSINCVGCCGWHGWLTDGVFTSC